MLGFVSWFLCGAVCAQERGKGGNKAITIHQLISVRMTIFKGLSFS
jgi:hypothetical protein